MNNQCARILPFLSVGKLDLDKLFLKGEGLITFCSPYAIKIVQDNELYLDMLSRFDHVYCDGMLLVKHCNYLVKGKRYVRQSFDGNSLAADFFSCCVANHSRVAFVGGVPGVSEKAAELAKDLFGINVVFERDGFFDGDYAELYSQIVAHDVNVIVVGMGVVYQEECLLKLQALGWRGIGVTCGGYFDQMVCGSSAKYYPDWVNRYNLRAIYRLIKEPRRLGKRYFIDYLPFYRDVLRYVCS